jgi:hypothetical protein
MNYAGHNAMSMKGKYGENQENRIGRKSETEKRQKRVKKLCIYFVRRIG